MTPSSFAGKLEILQIQRVIPASPERLFNAWTDAKELTKWWGPKGVRCLSADVDLRIGGRYRIANELPDGTVLWISGTFKEIAKPNLLRYTWVVETDSPTTEQVTVRFDQHQLGTMITIVHDKIPGEALRDQHEHGWIGCLEGLLEFVS